MGAELSGFAPRVDGHHFSEPCVIGLYKLSHEKGCGEVFSLSSCYGARPADLVFYATIMSSSTEVIYRRGNNRSLEAECKKKQTAGGCFRPSSNTRTWCGTGTL